VNIGNSARAPIFYDSNNTAFFLDPASTSNLDIIRTYIGARDTNGNWATGFQNTPVSSKSFHGDIASGGPAGTWWFYESMRHSNASNFWGTQIAWGWEDNSNRLFQRNVSSNSFSGWVEYLTTGGRTFSGNLNMTGSIISTASDVRAPIFYDQNNTDYRIDPTDVSRIVLIRADHYGRAAHNTGFLRGGYNNIGASEGQTSPIYCIGSSYEPAATTLSSMYGIGFTAGGSFMPSGAEAWGLYIASDGNARIFLSGGNGNITATGNITAYASDRRLKTNITPISNALDKVMKIRGVEFDWVDNIEELGFQPQSMHETGVIAQEIQAVISDAVRIAPFNKMATDISGVDNEYLTVDKEKIVPLLIEAIKEQQTYINTLEDKINIILQKLEDK
jgi:hypothetical protein